MAYGTPSSNPSSSVWSLVITDSTTGAALGLTTGPLGDFPLADFEALAQKAVTALDGHADITITASRTYLTSQDVTP